MKNELKTNRGFKIIKFKDKYNDDCSVQEASIGGLWIGASELKLMVGYPWREIPHSEIIKKFSTSENGVIVANNRILINKNIAKKLIKILQKYIDTGGL